MLKFSKRDYLKKGFSSRESGLYYHPVALDWANRVVANGGQTVPKWIVYEVGVHYKELVFFGLEPLIKANCLMVPGNLIAATTPLIKREGNDPWTNGNFVSSDLTVNGLKGDATSKYLATGMVPSSIFSNIESGGITIYFYDATPSTLLYMDVRAQSSTNSFGLIQFNGYVHADIWNESAGRILSAGVRNGYLSSNRISNTDFKVYNATSSIAHSTVGLKFTTGGTQPTSEIIFYCYNDNTTKAFFTGRTFSYASIHEGFTEQQSIDFFNSIQRFRNKIKGGSI